MGYIGMCRCEGYGFQAVYSRIGFINQSVWVKNRVSFFRKLISCLKILSILGTVVLGFVLAGNLTCFELVTSVVSRKQLLQDSGVLGEITLAQGSKIQLNQGWYRLWVLGSQRHIPTQKSLSIPPPGRLHTHCVGAQQFYIISRVVFSLSTLYFCLAGKTETK